MSTPPDYLHRLTDAETCVEGLALPHPRESIHNAVGRHLERPNHRDVCVVREHFCRRIIHGRETNPTVEIKPRQGLEQDEVGASIVHGTNHGICLVERQGGCEFGVANVAKECFYPFSLGGRGASEERRISATGKTIKSLDPAGIGKFGPSYVGNAEPSSDNHRDQVVATHL